MKIKKSVLYSHKKKVSFEIGRLYPCLYVAGQYLHLNIYLGPSQWKEGAIPSPHLSSLDTFGFLFQRQSSRKILFEVIAIAWV